VRGGNGATQVRVFEKGHQGIYICHIFTKRQDGNLQAFEESDVGKTPTDGEFDSPAL
jgi:hypothetical protein